MINFELKLITPDIARQYLSLNKNNRRIREPKIVQYVKDMLSGRWKEGTAECIKISNTGNILDGQHRLTAIVKSGMSIKMHVATGLDESVFSVLDTGKSRNAGDVFTIDNAKNSNVVPSIIAFYNQVSSGYKYHEHESTKPTNFMLLEMYNSDKAFWDYVSKKSLGFYDDFSKVLPPSFIGGLYAIFYKVRPDIADSFFIQLCQGIAIKNSTIGVLRNKYIADRISLRKLPRVAKLAYAIKAWNCYVQGYELKIIKFDSSKEELPLILTK